MQRNTPLFAGLLGLTIALSGCVEAHDPRLVNWYGSYSVDDETQLKITTLGMSQIQYELRHLPSDHVLLRSTGSSFQGWFFVWDDLGRLWGYWNDLGTVVWVPDGTGQFQRHVVRPGSPLLKQAPPQLAANMPDWARRTLGI